MLWGVQGLPGPAGRGGSLAGPAGAEESIRNMDARRRTIKAVCEDPCTGFGSIAQTLQQAQVRDSSISRGEVKAFLDGLRVNQDRPQRGYNSFVPLEPMNQLQVVGRHLQALEDLLHARRGGARKTILQRLRGHFLGERVDATTEGLHVGQVVYSDDGAEFKREFKELMDFWDIEKHSRSRPAGAVLMLADILSQINGRKHATTQVAPNLAYSDPEMAEIALRNIERRAKHKVTPRKSRSGI